MMLCVARYVLKVRYGKTDSGYNPLRPERSGPTEAFFSACLSFACTEPPLRRETQIVSLSRVDPCRLD